MCDRVAIIREGQIIETGALDELRHLTRVKVLAETVREIGEFENISGVHDIEVEGVSVSLHVDGEALDEAIKYIGSFGIVKLECTPPTLEDLFMRHYEGTGSSSRHDEGTGSSSGVST